VAAPDPIITAPLFPDEALPELKTNKPLMPAFPEFELRITTTPLDVAVPSPLPTTRAPPVWTVDRPEKACKDPPAPLVPLPTVTSTIPPRPAVATPLPMTTPPLFPELEDPELKYNAPLTPAAPLFRLRMITSPLVVAVPSPEDSRILPPVCTVLLPAAT